jgi:type IV secretory pathway TraG/TraD family ATPase VirD4
MQPEHFPIYQSPSRRSGGGLQGLGFFGGILGAVWITTQWLAIQWQYSPQLGSGWWQIGDVTIYPPWAGISWLWRGMRANTVTYEPLFKAAVITFGIALVCLWGNMITLGWWFGGRSSTRHVRGTVLREPKDFQRKLGRWGKGLRLAGFFLPRELLANHMLTAGSTGSGKTTVQRHALRQLDADGETVVVVDPEQEFLREFYDVRRGDVILNPLDARFPGWSPWKEITQPGDAEQVAASLIPEPPTSHATETYFKAAARQLFVSLLEKIDNHDPQELAAVLSGNPRDLLKLIAGTRAAASLDVDARPQMSGILSTLSLAVEGFRYLRKDEDGWSAREWLRQRKGWIFLTFQSSHKAACLPQISLWIDLLIRRMLEGEIGGKQWTWVVLSEPGSLQPLPALADLLTRGRKRRIPTLIEIQAVTQMQQRYGRLEAATLLAAPSTRLIMRAGDPETSAWAADMVGRREVLRAQDSETAFFSGRRGRSESRQHIRREEGIAMPAEIEDLRYRQGYLRIAGVGVTPVEIEECPLTERVPGFVPRPERAAEEKNRTTVPQWKPRVV